MKKIKFIFIIITLVFSYQAKALDVLLDSKNLTKEQTLSAKSALKNVLEKLPVQIGSAINSKIKIEFRDIKSNNQKVHLGSASFLTNSIVLNKDLLADNPSTYLKLMRVLSHEIAHFYDKAIKVSDDSEFVALMGWKSSKQINNFTRRLPDPYMNVSKEETFPTVLEYYLFDPQFHCRMPEVSNFLSKHFRLPQQSHCDNELTWYMTSISRGIEFASIDRSQIWSIDYLWASEGDGLASSFGHGMLRLVVCSKDRVPGPDCYKDTGHHIILSFAALSQTGDFASVSGLSGKYPMNLYAMSFATARLQYNMTELRDLYAVPLKLSKENKSQLIDVLYAQHWNLNGDYYFLSQNCATEIARSLLASGINGAEQLATNNPRTLFTKILSSHLSFNYSRQDLEKNNLLYFKSSLNTVNAALAQISDTQIVTVNDIKQYLERATPPVIRSIVEANQKNQRLLYSLYYLEGIRVGRYQAEVLAESLKNQKDSVEFMRETIQTQSSTLFSYRFAGSFLDRSSYGIPSTQEATSVRTLIADSLQKISDHFKDSHGDKVNEIINKKFSQVTILEQRKEWLLRLATEAGKNR